MDYQRIFKCVNIIPYKYPEFVYENFYIETIENPIFFTSFNIIKPVFTIQKVILQEKSNFSAFYIIIQIVKFLYCSNEIKIVRKHTK